MLTDYLTQKIIKAGWQNRGRVVVVGGQNKRRFLSSKATRKGADVVIILHAMDATARVTTFSRHRSFHFGSQTLYKSLQEHPSRRRYSNEQLSNYSSANFSRHRLRNLGFAKGHYQSQVAKRLT